jgi:type IV secretion system protein VirB1
MTMALAVVLQLAATCAPNVAPETTAAIAKAESGFDPLAINDNTTRLTYFERSVQDAVARASMLRARGHSIDLGLMQINSANLDDLGLSIADSFDPCRSIAAGARVLSDAYAGGATRSAEQAALRIALSRYNTGRRDLGFRNGYVRQVERAALRLVPALEVTGIPPTASPPPASHLPESTRPAPMPDEAEGEWHVAPPLNDMSSGDAGEWHAGATQPQPDDVSAPIARARAEPASVVVLHDQQGSKP